MRKPIVAFVAGCLVGAFIPACAGYWFWQQEHESRVMADEARQVAETGRQQTEAAWEAERVNRGKTLKEELDRLVFERLTQLDWCRF